MKKDFLKLYNSFNEIEKKGWIKSKRSGTTGIGYTFESLLNKKEDYFQMPDYDGIEIKTVNYNSKQKIHLFNMTPDGDFLFPIKRIISKIGYPDRDYPQYKVFNVSVKSKPETILGYKKLKLYVNYKKKKIDLLVNTIEGKKIKIDISWSFESLKKALYLKLQKLAIIDAYSNKEKNDTYYYYNSISFYILRNFNTFIYLIEKGIIEVTFKIGVHKDGEQLGKIHDRGTDFSIMKKDIELLFKKINI